MVHSNQTHKGHNQNASTLQWEIWLSEEIWTPKPAGQFLCFVIKKKKKLEIQVTVLQFACEHR